MAKVSRSRISLTDQTGLAAGLFTLGMGVVGFVLVQNLAVGTASFMGPGYLPRAATIGLCGLGLLRTGQALTSGRTTRLTGNLVYLLVILASILAFALLLEPLGFFLSSMVVVLASRLALSRSRLVETIILSVVVAAVCSIVFVTLLEMPMEIFPW
jgi:hypothetical protein